MGLDLDMSVLPDPNLDDDLLAELNSFIKDEDGTSAHDTLANVAMVGQSPALEQSAPPEPLLPMQPPQQQESRSVSVGALPQIPASEPPAPPTLALPLPAPPTAFSEAPCPPSDCPDGRTKKNFVKKQTIKQRLENAIASGEMPPFCGNCGAVETPTWRKMWTQDHEGVPGYHEYSEKPGQVTAIDILERDADGKPTKYRLIKKTMASRDDKKDWNEMLLCNRKSYPAQGLDGVVTLTFPSACGIWLGKFKSHRPPERWEKDRARLTGEIAPPRRKRESRAGQSRSKKARTKSDSQIQPTSEAYFTTDPLGPPEQENSPEQEEDGGDDSAETDREASREGSRDFRAGSNPGPALRSSPRGRHLGSTHSRGSGTANSPIALEDDLGFTRRLLFPSPRKDGVPKVLGDVSLNVVKSASGSPTERASKTTDKENAAVASTNDDMADLFGTPPRPSTPPPRSSNSIPSGPFKTPTQPTPSHRPITRSVSKTIRSAISFPKSPSQCLAALQKTPTRTPRSHSRRRMTPGRSGAHSGALGLGLGLDMGFEDAADHMSPFTAHLSKLLSEAHDFTAGSPSHGLHNLDLGVLPNLESEGLPLELLGPDAVDDANRVPQMGDFTAYLNSTDMLMPPTSSPMMSRGGPHVSFASCDDDDLWGDVAALGGTA